MSFFDYIKNKLFSTEAPANEPFIREELKRSDAYLQEYQDWKNSEACYRSLGFIYEQHAMAAEDQNVGMFRSLSSSHSNGFLLRYPEGLESKEFSFLFDYLRDAVKAAGYLPYMSDRQVFTKEDNLETIERHYLKPSWRAQLEPKDGKIEQLYGNTSIELFLQDDVPSHIKLMSNSYNDHKYHPPKEFGDLVKHIALGGY